MARSGDDAPASPAANAIVHARISVAHDIETLATQLAEEMAERWRHGERPVAEEWLERYPEVRQNAEAAVELIYEEICLRHEYQQEVPAERFLKRFPQWRKPLEVLLNCHRLLEPAPAPTFPGPGERFGEFQLISELGSGGLGRVYLARQASLGNRPVVLKVTPCGGREHLSLARLQHTYIVPLYAVHEEPGRNLRALCMPYFGSATLKHLLEQLQRTPLAQRTGQHLVEALDAIQSTAPLKLPGRGPARKMLARYSFAQSMCWIGSCLAEALHYAHERGLVHLDLKPSNVLLAADAQPMLLDFHLAQQPIAADQPPPEWIGGTPLYMSEEQHLAVVAVQRGEPIAVAVDGRADIYALGALLYEALGGQLPFRPGESPVLHRCNPQVSAGLSDIIHRCLERWPEDRYQHASELSLDLQRHLQALPLAGVANRSWLERWRKWRRRRPHILAVGAMAAAVILAAVTLGVDRWKQNLQQLRHCEMDLAQGQQYSRKGDYTEALRWFHDGISRARNLVFADTVTQQLQDGLQEAQEALTEAERRREVQRLHAIADQLRFQFGAEVLPAPLEQKCEQFWEAREQILQKLRPGSIDSEEQRSVQHDLLDLAIFWTDLRVRQASPPDRDAMRRHALDILNQAEATLGPDPILYRERQAYAQALGWTEVADKAAAQASALPLRTPWQHFAVGVFHLQRDELRAAQREFQEALRERPRDFWPNFYQGLVTSRLADYPSAIGHFSVCIGLMDRPECYYNRALAYAAAGQVNRALEDYQHTIDLAPEMGSAFLNRAMLRIQQKQYAEAEADLARALAHGANAVMVHYDRALIHKERGERSAALNELAHALHEDANHRPAQDLQKELQRGY